MSGPARLFRGGRIFDGHEFHERSGLRVDAEGSVVELGQDLVPLQGEEVVELDGSWLLPGIVDCHVHFREPGLVRKEGYATGSAGALHGGVTSVLEIQNNPPLMTSGELLDEKYCSLEGISRVDFGCYASLVPEAVPAMGELAGLSPAAKCFLGCSTGAGGVDDPGTLRELFAAAAAAGMPVVAHCEDNQVMRMAAADAGDDPAPRHDQMRPVQAEVRSITDALAAARETGAELHVFHVSTAEGARLVQAAAADGQVASMSTAPHYLLLTGDEAEAAGQNRLKVNPSIKSAADRDALAMLLASGNIGAVGTDHAPHPLEEKDRPYAKAPSGFPSIDLLLPLMFAVHDRQGIDLERVLAAVTSGPAAGFGLERKGVLEPGRDADLVIVDPGRERVVEESQLPSKSKWSPYQGWTLRGFPQRVFLRGREVFADGEAVGEPAGRRLF